MPKTRIDLNIRNSEGINLVVDDPEVWNQPIRECGMTCRITRPLTCTVEILPQEAGYLVRGNLQGEVVVPCDRCAEDAVIELDHRFTTFEDLPDDGKTETPLDPNLICRTEKGGLEFDLGALVWEEFVLALPVHPLCKPDCKGICPQCGKNLNEGECACVKQEGDPRLAVFRSVRIAKPQAKKRKKQ